jgi:hypothetical protein
MVRRKDGLIDVKASAGIMIERNPGVMMLWYTRRHHLLNVHRRAQANAGAGTLFQLGRPFKLEWYTQGRPATRAEILESIESGLPILRETAAQQDGPAGVAYLETQIVDAMKLVPRM